MCIIIFSLISSFVQVTSCLNLFRQRLSLHATPHCGWRTRVVDSEGGGWTWWLDLRHKDFVSGWVIQTPQKWILCTSGCLDIERYTRPLLLQWHSPKRSVSPSNFQIFWNVFCLTLSASQSFGFSSCSFNTCVWKIKSMDSTGETLVAFVKLLSNLHLPLLGKVIELVIKRSALPFSRRRQFKYFPRPHRQQLFKWRSLVCDMCKKVIFVIITACHYIKNISLNPKICLRLRTRTGGSERILSPAFSERLATYHWKNPWKGSKISFKNTK